MRSDKKEKSEKKKKRESKKKKETKKKKEETEENAVKKSRNWSTTTPLDAPSFIAVSNTDSSLPTGSISKSKQFVCGECGEQYGREGWFRRHMINVHGHNEMNELKKESAPTRGTNEDPVNKPTVNRTQLDEALLQMARCDYGLCGGCIHCKR